MSRERYSRHKPARKQDKLIRQGMTIHESRLPTLWDLRDTLEGIAAQCEHQDLDFGFRSVAQEDNES